MWEGILLLVLSAICAGILYSNISRSGWNQEGELNVPKQGTVGSAAH
jgi:hypothetical protein